MSKAIYVRCYGDWEGVYIDGELVKEDHNLSPRQWLKIAVQYDIDEYDRVSDVALGEDYDRASLPKYFDELDE